MIFILFVVPYIKWWVAEKSHVLPPVTTPGTINNITQPFLQKYLAEAPNTPL